MVCTVSRTYYSSICGVIDMYFFAGMFILNIILMGSLYILSYILDITTEIDKNGINKGHIAVVIFISILVMLAHG